MRLDYLPERPGVEHCEGDPPPWGPANESFDGGSGILAGLAVGYRLGSFRVEGEYFYRGTRYGSTDEPGFPDDTVEGGVWYPSDSSQYNDGVEDAVDNVMSHNFFANLYYDYRSDSKFTPYVGVGIGSCSGVSRLPDAVVAQPKRRGDQSHRGSTHRWTIYCCGVE